MSARDALDARLADARAIVASSLGVDVDLVLGEEVSGRPSDPARPVLRAELQPTARVAAARGKRAPERVFDLLVLVIQVPSFAADPTAPPPEPRRALLEAAAALRAARVLATDFNRDGLRFAPLRDVHGPEQSESRDTWSLELHVETEYVDHPV